MLCPCYSSFLLKEKSFFFLCKCINILCFLFCIFLQNCYLSINIFIYLFIYQSINNSINILIYLSINLSFTWKNIEVIRHKARSRQCLSSSTVLEAQASVSNTSSNIFNTCSILKQIHRQVDKTKINISLHYQFKATQVYLNCMRSSKNNYSFFLPLS